MNNDMILMDHAQRFNQRYWRSTSQFEVDLVLDESTAIEIKATDSPHSKHLKGLVALREERMFRQFILVCTVLEERCAGWNSNFALEAILGPLIGGRYYLAFLQTGSFFRCNSIDKSIKRKNLIRRGGREA